MGAKANPNMTAEPKAAARRAAARAMAKRVKPKGRARKAKEKANQRGRISSQQNWFIGGTRCLMRLPFHAALPCSSSIVDMYSLTVTLLLHSNLKGDSLIKTWSTQTRGESIVEIERCIL